MLKCNRPLELFIREVRWQQKTLPPKKKEKEKKVWLPKTSVTMSAVAMSSLRIYRNMSYKCAISGLVVRISRIFKIF